MPKSRPARNEISEISINPLEYRYLPTDKELHAFLIENRERPHLEVFNGVCRKFIHPRLCSLEQRLRQIAEENKNKKISRRVDGKVIGEIPVEEVFLGYASRLGQRIAQIELRSPIEQSLPEPVLWDRISDLSYYVTAALGVEANIANDVRHQWRSEIDEYGPLDWGSRVGSSTMPHKVNPADYEQIVSFWKVFAPRFTTALLTHVTEHQGDSTNQGSLKYYSELLIQTCISTRNLEKALSNLEIR